MAGNLDCRNNEAKVPGRATAEIASRGFPERHVVGTAETANRIFLE